MTLQERARELEWLGFNQFRTMKDRFNAPDDETLYREWMRRGESALESLTGRIATKPPQRPSARDQHVPFDDSQFGSLPGIA